MTNIPPKTYAGKITVCAACAEPIIYLGHERTGKLAPITIASYPNGNILPMPDNRYRALGPEKAKAERADGTNLALNHFANCPNAASFKR